MEERTLDLFYLKGANLGVDFFFDTLSYTLLYSLNFRLRVLLAIALFRQGPGQLRAHSFQLPLDLRTDALELAPDLRQLFLQLFYLRAFEFHIEIKVTG